MGKVAGYAVFRDVLLPNGSSIVISRLIWRREALQKSPKETLDPAPLPLEDAGSFAVGSFIVLAASGFFGASSGGHLCRRPCVGPDDLAGANPIMGFAWKLPIADGRVQRRAAVSLIKTPLGCAERSADFGAATTCTEMERGPNSSET